MTVSVNWGSHVAQVVREREAERLTIPVSGSHILSAMARYSVVGTPEYIQGWEDAVREIRSILYGYPDTNTRD